MTVSSLQNVETLERIEDANPSPILKLTMPSEDYAGLLTPLWLFAFLLPPIAILVRWVVPWWLMLTALVLISISLISTLAKVTAWLRAPQQLHLFTDHLVLQTRNQSRIIKPDKIVAARWRPGASRPLAGLYALLAVILAISAFIFRNITNDPNLAMASAIALALMSIAAAAAGSILWRMGPTIELVIEQHHTAAEPIILIIPERCKSEFTAWLGPDAPVVSSLAGEDAPLRSRMPQVDLVPWVAMLIPLAFGLILTIF